MNGWMILWKAVFIIGITVFFGMSVWVTIAGFGDIKKLFRKINREHEQGEDDED